MFGNDRGRLRRIAWLAGAVCAPAALVSGCGSSHKQAEPAAKIQWHACKPEGQCGTMRVPLSYQDPGGKRIRLSLFRLPAKDPSRRIGTLMLNPGGPGASGVQFVRLTAIGFPAAIRKRFDIVGWDPRGVGSSEAIDCGPALAANLKLDQVPVTSAQRAALAAGEKRFGAACKRKMGAILGNVSTVDTADDMDRIRAALGDRRISYVGYSYGTYLGAVYANMFPKRVRAMVLDGVENPGQSEKTTLLIQARGLETIFDRFVAKCAAQPSCAFHSGGHPGAAFDSLVRRIESKPIAVGKRRLGPTQFFYGVANPLYGDQQGELAKGLAAAAAGNGKPLLKQFDDYSSRKPNGTYSTELSSNSAINCLDGQGLGNIPALQQLEHRFTTAAPRFGRFVLYSNVTCGYWPEKARPPKLPITAKGAGPIVVIGSTGDPITPYASAVALAHQLPSGVLLTASSAGHTSNFGIGGPCDALGTKALVTGKPPGHATKCPAPSQ